MRRSGDRASISGRTGAASTTRSKLSSTNSTRSFANRLGDPVEHRAVRLVGHADDPRDRCHQVAFADGFQRDEPDLVGEIVGRSGSDLQREPGLADAPDR